MLENFHAAPELESIHKSKLLHVLDDLRDRKELSYRGFFDRLVPDVDENGIRVPLIGYREGDMRRITDGETRFRALLMGSQEYAPMLVYATRPDAASLKLGQVMANSMRQDMTVLEYAKAYTDLMKLLGISQAELCRRLHANPAQMSKIMAISTRLCPEVQAMVAGGEVVPRAAYAISKIVDIPIQIDLAKKVREGLLCVEGVEMQVSKLLGNKPKIGKSLKVSHGGVTAVVKGNPVEALKAFLARVGDAIKRIEKDNLPPDFLGGLVK